MLQLELSKEARADAIASIRRYFEENLSEPVGELAAGLLLNFFIDEIGPAIYNRAISDAQRRMKQRAADLSGELFFPEFQYWARVDSKKKRSK
ncbi:MAG: DUF2164 domain-containing protein [Acidobacteriaceae bacterium]